MIQNVRHLSFRLWCTAGIGGGLCLLLLPILHPIMGLRWSLIPAGLILLAVFVLSGRLVTRRGRAIVHRLWNEAAAWEQAGAPAEAEDTLQRAATIGESFLLAPRAAQRCRRKTATRLVRLYLSQGHPKPVAAKFVASRLAEHPQDPMLSAVWLQWVAGKSKLQPCECRAAEQILIHHPKLPQAGELLAREYLKAGRYDFQALQVYRRVIRARGAQGPRVVIALCNRFLTQWRIDDLALEVYLRARLQGVSDPILDQCIDACRAALEETAENRHLLRAARRVLAGRQPASPLDTHAESEPAEDSKELSTPPAHDAGESRRATAVARIGEQFRRVNAFGGSLLSMFRFRLRNAFGALADIVAGRTRKPLARLGLLLLITAGLVGLGVNTALHLSANRTPGPVSDPKTSKNSGRFTLQVAAFRERGQAEHYVRRLAGQNIDAYWIPARSGDRFWYQVRVSRFESPEEARALGKALKNSRTIDDYYVANYR